LIIKLHFSDSYSLKKTVVRMVYFSYYDGASVPDSR